MEKRPLTQITDLKKFKREAKRLRASKSIPLSKAQEMLARRYGYQTLHELIKVGKTKRPPRVLCFDLETEPFSKRFKEAKSYEKRLANAPRLRLACVYDVANDTYYFFDKTETKALIRLLKKADVLLSYNGRRFDLLVLQRHYGLVGKLPGKGEHIDLIEVFSKKCGYWVSLDVASRTNLGERKLVAGAKIKDCSQEEARAACKSDASQTFRLWKLHEADELVYPGPRFREESERDFDTLGQNLEDGETSVLEDLLEDEGVDDIFDELTEGQFADASAGFS